MTVTQSSYTLTVGQLAERSGVAVSALHFYEAKSLITSSRTSGNQRRYGRDTLRRVAFIRFAQRVGVPLAEIRDALASLPEQRTPTRADWAALSANWRTQLDDRIVALQRLRDDLSDCIGCGCLSLDRCALSNPEDVLGGAGPGPRRLLAGLTSPKSEPTDTGPDQAGNDVGILQPAATCTPDKPAATCTPDKPADTCTSDEPADTAVAALG